MSTYGLYINVTKQTANPATNNKRNAKCVKKAKQEKNKTVAMSGKINRSHTDPPFFRHMHTVHSDGHWFGGRKGWVRNFSPNSKRGDYEDKIHV